MAITIISHSHNTNAAIHMHLPGVLLNILLKYHPPEAIVVITMPPKFLNLHHYTHVKCK